jgi:ABC-type uncharacterized transport system ATPase subunit
LPPDPRLLLLENPPRGLDLESVNWVWQHLQSCSRKGTSIVFSSPELDEILMVADRGLVFSTAGSSWMRPPRPTCRTGKSDRREFNAMVSNETGHLDQPAASA